jgi:hypothetical protein
VVSWYDEDLLPRGWQNNPSTATSSNYCLRGFAPSLTLNYSSHGGVRMLLTSRRNLSKLDVAKRI